MKFTPGMQTPENIQFVVETAEVIDGHKLKAIVPDDDGYFCNFPIAVLGVVSRNSTYYDVPSIQQQMTSPTSQINMCLTQGNLFGEWGHPYLDPKKPDLQRLLTVLEEKQSHQFRRIMTGPRLDNGGIVLLADVKPTGPYKEQLLEQMLDPNINNSFSLRSICSERVDRAKGIIFRTVKRLVTFDAVGAGGYAEASKRYVAGGENLDVPLDNESIELKYEDFVDPNTGEYATESIKDKDILDLFGAKEMVVRRQVLGTIIPGSKTFIDTEGNKRSVIHAINSK